ncbi:MAG: hypothetical protein WBG35_06930 [Acidobacteriaceae bacterium]
MRHRFLCTLIAICFAAHFGAAAQGQSSSGEVSKATTAPAAVAYVYLQTIHGVNAYAVASSGKLTLVAGSPFNTLGLMMGGTGKYFITLGTFDIHSYLVASNGAIGKQAAAIDTSNYDGSQCEFTNSKGGPAGTIGGILDPSGQTIYVLLENGTGCVAYQAFNIAKSNGAFAFKGTTIQEDGTGDPYSLSIPGSNHFAYDIRTDGANMWFLYGFKRLSNGSFEHIDFKQAGPAWLANNSDAFYSLAADSTNHLAAGIAGRLASFTVDSAGNLTTTNTANELPSGSGTMKISPAGNLLAVYTGDQGLKIYHFNGAKPITPYSEGLESAPIDQLAWDNSNHLFAIGVNSRLLFEYTITPTKITAVPGSPFATPTINPSAWAGALVVVPK